jgi:ribosomal protein S18 acetylase RimI-like enzyme
MNTKRIRAATPDDAPHLVRFFRWAGEGLPDLVWAAMAAPGQSVDDVGLERAKREDGDFSYRNAHVLEADGTIAAGIVAYRLPSEPVPAGPDFPAAFVPFHELESLAPGHWYVYLLATVPEARGKGPGTALLRQAEERAVALGCPGLAIIVSGSNPGVARLYARMGYEEKARRRLDIPGWLHSGTDAVLLLKPL